MPESTSIAVASPWRKGARPHALALAVIAGLTAAAYPLAAVLDHANIVMAYLLAVALIALVLGRDPAISSAIASVLLFDFFFVEPRFSFAVADVQYLITFGVMLAVALIIGALTARLRAEADTALVREAQTRALYGLAQDLSGALTVAAVADAIAPFVREHFAARSDLWLPDADGGLAPLSAHGSGDTAAIARQVFATGVALPFVERSATGAAALALPLIVAGRPRGVLTLTATRDGTPGLAVHPLQDAIATLAGIVVERLHYVDVAREALVQAESERLRNSLLSAVSHDLRTPLTVLVGHADALAGARPPLPAAQAEAAAVIRDEALRLSRMVSDLLDMARLQAGRVVLRKEWQPLDDVVATSIRALEAGLPEERRVTIDLPADLPPVAFDAVLIERALANLLDNAAHHGRGTITVRARAQPGTIEVDVADEGPGLAPGTEAAVFRMFEQACEGSRHGGAGMGLAIAKAIVEAHGGTIRVGTVAPHGACFTFALPRGTPPPAAADADDAGRMR